jgi:hypothetical protein
MRSGVTKGLDMRRTEGSGQGKKAQQKIQKSNVGVKKMEFEMHR